MMFPAFFIAVFLSGLEPEANPTLTAPAHPSFWDVPDAASIIQTSAADWPSCALRLDCQRPFSGEINAILPSHAHLAVLLQTPDRDSFRLRNARANFVDLIPEGSLVKFEDQDGSVIFRSTPAANPMHRPGPMEDEVIASAVRRGIAANAELQKLKLTVECHSGKVRISGAAESTLQAISLVKLALEVNGVEKVRIDLPPDLRTTGEPMETVSQPK